MEVAAIIVTFIIDLQMGIEVPLILLNSPYF